MRGSATQVQGVEAVLPGIFTCSCCMLLHRFARSKSEHHGRRPVGHRGQNTMPSLSIDPIRVAQSTLISFTLFNMFSMRIYDCPIDAEIGTVFLNVLLLQLFIDAYHIPLAACTNISFHLEILDETNQNDCSGQQFESGYGNGKWKP